MPKLRGSIARQHAAKLKPSSSFVIYGRRWASAFYAATRSPRARVSRRRGKPGAAMLGQQCNTCSALPGRRMRRLTKVIQTHVCGLETDAPGLEGASHKTKPAPSRWGSSQKNCCAPPALV
jgi:hypothetical protein